MAGIAAGGGRRPTERKKYPVRAEDYQLLEQVGQGVSALVYRALCIPFDEIVSIKIVDFESMDRDLSNICREAQTMILIDHPNVLNAHCSFVNDQNLWVVMPYMEGGSCLHIIKSAYPNGFEEPVIATVLCEVLKGLEYLHHQGYIHCDVKAGNILVDAQGSVKLGDFGISAWLFDLGDGQRSRNTFVGTSFWMAPEVKEKLHGYDFKADMWSFGITALQLAHGHAPFSKYPPIKVRLMSLQNAPAPPGLDYERDKKFSRSFRDMIAMCLVKDPSKRPSAHTLLKQPFFKQARSQDYIAQKILNGLPTLGDGHQALKEMEEDLLAQKKMLDSKKDTLSQNEYKREISSWNFDIENLRAQASSIPENDQTKDSNGCQMFEVDSFHERIPEATPSGTNFSLKHGDDDVKRVVLHEPNLLSPDQPACYQRTKSDRSDNELKAAGANDQNVLHLHSSHERNTFIESCRPDFHETHLDNLSGQSCHEGRLSMMLSLSELNLSPKGESLKKQNQLQKKGNCNGELKTVIDIPAKAVLKSSKSAGVDDLEDKSKHQLVQHKGRFKVMSENVDLDKVFSQPPSPTTAVSAEVTPDLLGLIYQNLHSILQKNILEKDYILSLMKQLSTAELSSMPTTSNCLMEGVSLLTPTVFSEKCLMEAANEREKELVQEISDIHLRIICAVDELKWLRGRNCQANNTWCPSRS